MRVYSIGKERGWTEARRLVEFYRRLGLLLHEQTYDACFAHMQERFAVLAAPLLKLKHIPVTLWYTHPHTPLALRAAIKTVDRVITADSSSCRIQTSKLLATGHGIDTDRFVPDFCDRSGFRVVAVGRVTPIKRLELARCRRRPPTEPAKTTSRGTAHRSRLTSLIPTTKLLCAVRPPRWVLPRKSTL